MSKITRKLVIVGDGACGKKFCPTISENYRIDITLDGKHLELTLWDTPSEDEYERLRPLSYPDSHVILICFAVDNRESFDNVQWIPEVTHFCYGLPFILIGCKLDLRRDPKSVEQLKQSSQSPVTPEEGIAIAHEIGAKTYLECSAKTGENVATVFEAAARAAMLRATTRCTKGIMPGKLGRCVVL